MDKTAGPCPGRDLRSRQTHNVLMSGKRILPLHDAVLHHQGAALFWAVSHVSG